MNNTNKKHSVNPALVFTLVSLFAFSTGLVLGLLSPSWMNKESQKPGNSPRNSIENIDPVITNTVEDNTENPELPKSQKDSMDRYRKMLEKTFDSEIGEMESLSLFGVSVGSYPTVSKASEVSIDLKKRYPDWDISVYKINQIYTVVVGSFSDKEDAEKYLQTFPKQSMFLRAQVIQVPQRQPEAL